MITVCGGMVPVTPSPHLSPEEPPPDARTHRMSTPATTPADGHHPMTAAPQSGAATDVRTLVRRAQAGDAEAFGALYDLHVDTVFRFIYARVRHRPIAEDLTHDTFVKALSRLGSYQDAGGRFIAWLMTIARNTVLDHHKSGRRRFEWLTDETLEISRRDDTRDGDPETTAIDGLDRAPLLAAVRQLSPDQQECIALRLLVGLTVAETAEATGRTPQAVRSLQYRAVRELAALVPASLRPSTRRKGGDRGDRS